jgi:hypothetical protein
MLKGIVAGILVALLVGLVTFINPILAVIGGLFSGWVLKIFFGSILTGGLNSLFNTTRFTPEMLPMICATLAVIGSYFKSSQTNNNNKKEN